jgi:Virulence factor
MAKAAMRAQVRDSDSYLAEWRRTEPVPCGDDLEAEVTAAAARLEADYDDERLDRLIASGGRA